jgi:transcriptional regulator with XRE-family HTH domain
MASGTLIALAEVRRATKTGRARAIREAAALSQTEIARSVGVAQATVSLWESGRRTPRGKPAERYALILRELERLLTPYTTPKEREARLSPGSGSAQKTRRVEGTKPT